MLTNANTTDLTNTDFDSNGYCNCDGNGNFNRNSYSHSYGYCYSYCDSYRDSNFYTRTELDPTAYTHAERY